MSDIVKKLRQLSQVFPYKDSADEIERLRHELDKVQIRMKELEEDLCYAEMTAEVEAGEVNRLNSELRKAQGEPVGYQRIFDAIAAGVDDTDSGIEVSVKDFKEAIGGEIYASAPTIPEGWQLVPIMPTKKMIENAHLAEHCGNTDWHFVRAYSAMLAAAPKYGE